MTNQEPARYFLHRLKASEIDMEATSALINRAFSRHEILAGDRTSPAALLDEGGPGAEFLQVFTEAGDLVATTLMRPLAESDASFDAECAGSYLTLAAVEDGFTRMGLGTTLVHEAERISRARGCARVILGTVREFDIVPYYERRGYKVVSTQEFDGDHWSISLLHHYHEMEKLLVPSFRTAEAGDVGRVTEVVNAAYRVEDYFINGNRTNEAEIADLIAKGEIVVLLDESDEIAGAVQVTCEGPRGHLGMLSIDPARQHTGWGKFLVETCEQRAIDAGCCAMELTVVNLREPALPAWYRRLGYAVDGTLPFPDPARLSQPAHLVSMSKRLTAGSEGREIWR